CSGLVLGLKDVIHFEGSNAAELRASFEGGIDDYLSHCIERGEASDRPFNGKILVRTKPELHREGRPPGSGRRRELQPVDRSSDRRGIEGEGALACSLHAALARRA